MEIFPMVFFGVLFLVFGIYILFISFLKDIILNPFFFVPLISIVAYLTHRYWNRFFPESYDSKIWRFSEVTKKPWTFPDSIIQEYLEFEREETKISKALHEEDKIGKVGEIILAKIGVLRKHFSLLLVKEAQISERGKSFSSQESLKERISRIDDDLKSEKDQMVIANLSETVDFRTF